MKKILFLFALALGLTSCDPYQFDQSSSIELKKDPCFGVCPVYSFKMDGKGQASFEGSRNVSKLGKYTRQLSPDETNAVFTAFEQANFSAFQDEYTAHVTDLPTTWLSYKNGTVAKTVKDYYGSPEALKNLEKMVEKLAEEDTDWVKADAAQ